MSAATSKCLIINYLGTDYLYPYPVVELNIKDFITRFLEDNDIQTTVKLRLFNENVCLTSSCTLQFFGIQMGQRLELKPLQNNQPLVIRIQTLSGQERQYTLDDGKTMRDLYETIKIDKDLSSFTETFPILFNHRMHVMESDELLVDYLKVSNLIDWKTSQIPHFYLFECSRQFEMYAYNYQSGSIKEILYADRTWQPISCEKQTDNAMSIFLLSLYALTSLNGTNPDQGRIQKIGKEVAPMQKKRCSKPIRGSITGIFSFLWGQVETRNPEGVAVAGSPTAGSATNPDIDFHNRNETASFHFLTALRQTLFPPACLAFKHLMEGSLFVFEKQMLSEALYRLFRECLPEDIPNKEVFLYTPYIFCINIQKAQLISKEHDDYEQVILCKLCSRSDIEHDVHTYFTNPVIRLDKSSENFKLDELETKSTEAKNTYIDQTDLKVFMKWLNNYGQQWIPSKITKYTIWLMRENKDLFSIGNVFEQKKNISHLTNNDLKQIQKEICSNNLYSSFTFVRRLTLSKYNYMQFVLLNQPRRIAYLISPTKNNENCFDVYDPFNPTKHSFEKDEMASDDVLSELPCTLLRDDTSSVNLIEQLTVILFDVSASMKHTTVGDSKTLLDLSISAVGAWCDRFYSYRLPHAIGLLYCGAQVTPKVQLIHESCPITTNFKNFEDSLCARPNCGSSTPLYDAIDLALKMMNRFDEQYKDKMITNYQKLIICVSDGEDTCSKMTLPIIANKLQQEKVIFDSICFSDRQAASLVNLCQSTRGYYYFPIPHLDQDLITLFERETAMVVKNRDENINGVIETPKFFRPKALHSPAMNLEKAAVKNVPASDRVGTRILREANSLKQNPPENVEVFVGQDNILFWKVIVTGPTGTLYSGYTWLLSVEFHPDGYPIRPPDVRFITPIYHCNISDDGKICLEILQSKWTPSTTMSDLLQQILDLLRNPDPNNALSAAKGDIYKTARKVYDRELKLHTEKYAKTSIDELKKQYQLEGSDI